MAKYIKDLPTDGDSGMSLEGFLQQLKSLSGSIADVFQDLGADLDGLTKAAKKADKSTGKLKRTLLGFDEIYRLGASGGGKSAASLVLPEVKELDPVTSSLTKLRDAAAGLTLDLFGNLNTIFRDVLVPMGLWEPDWALPGGIRDLTQSVTGLNTVVGAVRGGIDWLMGSFFGRLETWNGGSALDGITTLIGKMAQIGTSIGENRLLLEGMTQSTNSAAGAAGVLNQSLGDVQQRLTGLGAAWKTAMTPADGGMKGMINGILSCFNGAISGTQGAVNRVVKAVNTLSFTVPDWIPLLGGKRFGFNLKTVDLPPIPYLAQGAVLPANKPFLAVVGDQKRGTNVEAPLATIQEAVALVMEDQTAAILAGFEASTQVQREILEAVLGIRIGDEVIARAADRYASKLAVVTGRG